MSFGVYGRAVAVGPEYQQFPGEGVRQYSDCPFDPDELPPIPEHEVAAIFAMPPPLFHRQELTCFLRNRFGRLVKTTEWLALPVQGRLFWHFVSEKKSEESRWLGVVPFPA